MPVWIPPFLVIFMIFVIFRLCVQEVPSSLLPWRSQDVGGSPQLQNGGLRALEQAWDDFLLEAFFCQVRLFSVLLGRLWVSPRGVYICVPVGSRRSRKAKSLRTVASELWKRPGATFCLRHFSVKSGRFPCSCCVSGKAFPGSLEARGWTLEVGGWRLELGG